MELDQVYLGTVGDRAVEKVVNIDIGEDEFAGNKAEAELLDVCPGKVRLVVLVLVHLMNKVWCSFFLKDEENS